jgi:hypothetical protein
MIAAASLPGLEAALVIRRVRTCDKSAAARNPVHFPLIEYCYLRVGCVCQATMRPLSRGGPLGANPTRIMDSGGGLMQD